MQVFRSLVLLSCCTVNTITNQARMKNELSTDFCLINCIRIGLEYLMLNRRYPGLVECSQEGSLTRLDLLLSFM